MDIEENINNSDEIKIKEFKLFDEKVFFKSLILNVDKNKIKFVKNNAEYISLINIGSVIPEEKLLEKKTNLLKDIGTLLNLEIKTEEYSKNKENEIKNANEIIKKRKRSTKDSNNKKYWVKFNDEKLKEFLNKMISIYTVSILKKLRNSEKINPRIGQLFTDKEKTFLLIHFELRKSICEIVRTKEKSLHYSDGKHEDESVVYYTLNLKPDVKEEFFFYQICRHTSCSSRELYGDTRKIKDFYDQSNINEFLSYLEQLKKKN